MSKVLVINNGELVQYRGAKKTFVIPSDVKRIADDAFRWSACDHIEMPIECPDFNMLELGSGSCISFFDVSGKKVAQVVLYYDGESDPKRDGAMRSLRSKEGRFDFECYDDYFYSFTKVPNKIRIALSRVEYPYEISEDRLNEYKTYLRTQSYRAGKLFVDNKEIDTLKYFAEMDLLTLNSVVKLIDYTNSSDNPELTAWLLDYKKKAFGDKKPAAQKYSIGSLSNESVSNDDNCMSLAEARKKYKLKYDRGNVILTKCVAREERIVIPEKIGNKIVTGINPYFLYISSRIRDKEVTIVIPQSVEHIDDYAFVYWENQINLEVVKGSYAEFYCKSKSIKYTTKEANPVVGGEKSGKTVAPGESWKKPKKGSHLISRYCGYESNVAFPSVVDGVAITGIGDSIKETVPANYKRITSVSIPEGYTYIGKNAFEGCENLETIILPSTINKIETRAFYGCKSLKELILRKGIDFHGEEIFVGSSIDRLIIESDDSHKLPNGLFECCKIKELVVIDGPITSQGFLFGGYYAGFPEALYSNYEFKTADVQYKVSSKFQIDDEWARNNVSKLHPLTEYDESRILDESVKARVSAEKKLPYSGNLLMPQTELVDSIDFPNCSFLLQTSLDIGLRKAIDFVITVKGGKVCEAVTSKLDYLVVPDGYLIPDSEYRKVLKLKKSKSDIAVITANELFNHIPDFDVSDWLEIANEYKFSINTGKVVLKEYIGNSRIIIIPEHVGGYPVTGLSRECFSWKHVLSVTVPGSIKTLTDSVFADCNHLESVTLKEGIEVIETAFIRCGKLTKLTLPDSVKEIRLSAFAYCKSMQELYVNDELNSVVDLKEPNKYGDIYIKRVYGSSKSMAKAIAEAINAEYVEINS